VSKKLPLKASPHRSAGDDDYKVGPGRPPRHTQFKKGQSGNPGGRKKDPLDLAMLLLEEAERPVSIKGSGETLTALQAIVRKQILMALNGSPRATKDLLDRLERLSGRTSSSESIIDDPGEDDALVERALRRRPATHSRTEGDAEDEEHGGDDD